MSFRSFSNAEISGDQSRANDRSETGMDINNKMKTLLQQNEVLNGKSIYSHLIACIRNVLEERPDNALDIFENVSACVGENKPRNTSTFQDISIDVGLAEIQRSLFSNDDGEAENEEAVLGDVETPLPNMMLHSFFYEQSGVGFNREELQRIWLAMQKLVDKQPVEHSRFWGKIFGLKQNYYVAEVEFRDGEELEESEEPEVVEEDRPESKQDEEGEVEVLPPKSTWKPFPAIPKEEFRTGTNKKLYFVCNEPGKPWIMLPLVTPAHIQSARKIKKVFTGCLDAEVICFPPFPGLEINLLRAQIARISSSTQISPIGFYTFNNDEEEETEEDTAQDTYTENTEYVPLRIKELVDPAFGNWVHHTQHILPQGRCVWWNPKQKSVDEFDEGEEGETEEETIEPEKGPALLTPIGQDAPVAGIEPWSVRLSSSTLPEYSVVTVSSNHWPGAHTFAYQKHFQNIYIGWGVKNQGGHRPGRMGRIMTEYVEDSQTKERLDPTPEEERALKASQNAPEEEEQDQEDEDNE